LEKGFHVPKSLSEYSQQIVDPSRQAIWKTFRLGSDDKTYSQ